MSCASTKNNGWPSHKEASWTLRGSLWAVSSDAERGWNQYLHCTSARHQRKENRSHRASGHKSGSEYDADKNLGKNGLHEGRSNSNESPTGRGQSRSDLRSRKNTKNGSPHGRTGSLDELPGGREFERRRPIHLGQRFRQEF